MAGGGSMGWDKAARPVGRVRLRFAGADRDVLHNFSAAMRVGDALFVAADEAATVNRFVRDGGIGGEEWVEDGSCGVAGLLPLATPEQEADLEGLAADDGWLWMVGSHARTRRKVEKEEGERIDLAALADLKDTRARCLLGRAPLVDRDGRWELAREDGDRRAGMLRQGKQGNALAKALRRDPLIGPFTELPAKEGGLDVEGIAVCGRRVALGLRAPVIADDAVMLEFEWAAGKSGRLKIASPPVKRLLAMEGLGVRDLKLDGEDLLILAGPSTGLSGPCALYRWRGWVNDPPRDADVVRLHRPERIVELPFGRGHDHPEGLALWDDGPRGQKRIMVVCDSPDPARMLEGGGGDGEGIAADLFRLPG